MFDMHDRRDITGIQGGRNNCLEILRLGGSGFADIDTDSGYRDLVVDCSGVKDYLQNAETIYKKVLAGGLFPRYLFTFRSERCRIVRNVLYQIQDAIVESITGRDYDDGVRDLEISKDGETMPAFIFREQTQPMTWRRVCSCVPGRFVTLLLDRPQKGPKLAKPQKSPEYISRIEQIDLL